MSSVYRKSAITGRALLLVLTMGMTAPCTAAYVPALTKVMSYTDIFGTTAFEGDVDVNASGQWIAASRKGVFLSMGNDQTQWQEVFAVGGAPMVNTNTVEILCRIADNGSWVVLNRAGLFRSTDADKTIGQLVTANIGTNNVYDVDMQPNGNWIASNSQGTRRLINATVSTLYTSADPGNGTTSTRRIVRMNTNGDWVIMTSAGVYKNGSPALMNPAGANVGGNVAYWSMDFNEQGDWVAISSKGTFLNGTRISVTPVNGISTIEANDVGEQIVRITNRDINNNFIWMAISPRGIYRNGVLHIGAGPKFSANKTQYTLDMNNSGFWISASENSALINGNLLTRDNITVQATDNVDNELIGHVNDAGDFLLLTNNGVYRNEARGLTNAKVGVLSTIFSPRSYKHILKLGTNGAAIALLDNTAITSTTGVYWGNNVFTPPEALPPQPANVVLDGNTLTWTNGGGTTASYVVAVSGSAATTNEGAQLYSGTGETFQITNFAGFTQDKDGATNYLSLWSVNSEGSKSAPVVFEYRTAPFRIANLSHDMPAHQVTLTWASQPGKSYSVERTSSLLDWTQVGEAGGPVPPAISTALVSPAEWTMTRTFSDPAMSGAGNFYRISTAP